MRISDCARGVFLVSLSLGVGGCRPSLPPAQGRAKVEVRYENGITRERYYVVKDSGGNSVKHGKYLSKYPNGQLCSACTYDYGIKVGREIFWHEYKKGDPINNKIDREILYDRNGQALFTVYY